jgi:hypothetical protein
MNAINKSGAQAKAAKGLVKAIRSIAPQLGCSDTVAFELFIQNTLVAAVEARKCHSKRLVLPFHVELAERNLGFVPISQRPVDKAVAQVGEAMELYWAMVREAEPFENLLSGIHPHFAAGERRKKLCQEFTPNGLAKTAFRFIDMDEREPGQDFKMYDMCCGAGSFALLGVKKFLETIASEDLVVGANDIDPLCSAMTALQLHANQWLHGPALGRVEVTVGDEIRRNFVNGYMSLSAARVNALGRQANEAAKEMGVPAETGALLAVRSAMERSDSRGGEA